MADTDEAYSNTKDRISCENRNVIDLLNIFTNPIAETLSQALILSLEYEEHFCN